MTSQGRTGDQRVFIWRLRDRRKKIIELENKTLGIGEHSYATIVTMVRKQYA